MRTWRSESFPFGQFFQYGWFRFRQLVWTMSKFSDIWHHSCMKCKFILMIKDQILQIYQIWKVTNSEFGWLWNLFIIRCLSKICCCPWGMTCLTCVCFFVAADGKERTLPRQRLQTFSQWLLAFWRQTSMVLKLKVKRNNKPAILYGWGSWTQNTVFCTFYMFLILLSDQVMRGGSAWQLSFWKKEKHLTVQAPTSRSPTTSQLTQDLDSSGFR